MGLQFLHKCLIALMLMNHVHVEGCQRVVCYYSNAAQHRPAPMTMVPRDMNVTHCTHLVFASARVVGTRLAPSGEGDDDDDNGSTGLYSQFNGLKRAKPDLKTLLAVVVGGGGGDPTRGTNKGFRELVAARSLRLEFTQNVISFLRGRGFNGLDLHWLCPDSRNRHGLTHLVRELRIAFSQEARRTGKERLLLTAVVSASNETINQGYEIATISHFLDFISVGYNFHESWKSNPLPPSPDESWDEEAVYLNSERAVRYWLERGTPREKLNLGLSFFGRSFSVAGPNNTITGLADLQNLTTAQPGSLAYYEVCKFLSASGREASYDDDRKVMSSVQDNLLVAFENQDSLRRKVDLVKKNHYGGVTLWSLDMDDFTGQFCGDGASPLLSAVGQQCQQASKAEGSDRVDDSCKRVVCYYTNWAQDRPEPANIKPDNVNESYCTHLIFAFAAIRDNRLDSYQWNEDSHVRARGIYAEFNELKTRGHRNDLKTLLAVSGWTFGTENFTKMVESEESRGVFVSHSMAFLRERDFDGLDLHREEYPASGGGSPAAGDTRKFTLLVKELRLAFEEEARNADKPRLLLTAAVAAKRKTVEHGYEISEIHQYLDFITVMTHDFHGPWDHSTGHNSPLYKDSKDGSGNDTRDHIYFNVHSAVKYWSDQGAPREKLNVGLALYGRSFTLRFSARTGLRAPAIAAGTPGKYTGEAGFLAYYEVCDLLNGGGLINFIESQKVPYFTRDRLWVGYDNPGSLREKVRYVKENSYGGVSVWAVDLDDFPGCWCNSGPYPLLSAISDECGITSKPANERFLFHHATRCPPQDTLWAPDPPAQHEDTRQHQHRSDHASRPWVDDRLPPHHPEKSSSPWGRSRGGGGGGGGGDASAQDGGGGGGGGDDDDGGARDEDGGGGDDGGGGGGHDDDDTDGQGRSFMRGGGAGSVPLGPGGEGNASPKHAQGQGFRPAVSLELCVVCILIILLK